MCRNWCLTLVDEHVYSLWRSASCLRNAARAACYSAPISAGLTVPHTSVRHSAVEPAVPACTLSVRWPLSSYNTLFITLSPSGAAARRPPGPRPPRPSIGTPRGCSTIPTTNDLHFLRPTIELASVRIAARISFQRINMDCFGALSCV